MDTLEQLRAQHAWHACQGCSNEYAKLAKSLPALIMNSGLMQVVALLHEKGSKSSLPHHARLEKHLLAWLNRQMQVPGDFEGFMEHLQAADAQRYQAITTEAFAWLRWLRQMAAARQGG